MNQIPLSQAKARLSEVVRAVREGGGEIEITVDGTPAARLVPVPSPTRRMTSAEVAMHDALLVALRSYRWKRAAFDAVELVNEGRR